MNGRRGPNVPAPVNSPLFNPHRTAAAGFPFLITWDNSRLGILLPHLPSRFSPASAFLTQSLDAKMPLVHSFRLSHLTALIFAVLVFEVGCGQFFPSSNSITALSIAPTNTTLAPGTTQQYTATATYGNNTTADVTTSVTWSTSPTATATVNSTGLVTAVALGTATVKATSGNVIASTGLTVTTKQISSIAIQPLTQNLNVSSANGPTTVQFTATATYKDGSTGDITAISTWTSVSSTSSVTISSTGLATAVAVGTATITDNSGGVTSNSATVTVSP